MAGNVYLVGAGPGRHDLITLRGLELIRECDVLLYDKLAGDSFLWETRVDCECIYVGKQAGHHSMKQEEINALLIKKAQEGKNVVRLKGGDPFVFGRGGEEAEVLIEHGIPFELVPGVTSAVAVPEAAGIPVTHRQVSRSFHVITAHSAGDQQAYLAEQIRHLRDTEGTLVFLMGLSHLEDICRELTAGQTTQGGLQEGLLEQTAQGGLQADVPGMAAFGTLPGNDKYVARFCENTPVAVISNGTLAEQIAVRGTLGTICEKVRKADIPSPAVIVVGETAALDLTNNLPGELYGCKIGMVGTASLMDKLERKFRLAGAQADGILEMQVIPDDAQDFCFEELNSFTWLVFTSANGVKLFFDGMKERKVDVRSLSGIKIAAVGSGTAQVLADRGIQADYVPDRYDTESLGEGLAALLRDGKHRVLLYRAEEANPVLEQKLKAAGAEICVQTAYRVSPGRVTVRDSVQDMDYLIFASASGVKGLAERCPKLWKELIGNGVPTAAAIGCHTADALRAAGCQNIIVAERFDSDGLVERLIQDWKERDGK